MNTTEEATHVTLVFNAVTHNGVLLVAKRNPA